jgi:Zn-dependent protease
MVFQFLLFDVPVSVHWTTIFLLLLFFADSFLYLKVSLKGKSNGGYIIAGIFSVTLIIFSVLVHEIGHAVVAESFGFKMTSAGITGAYAYVSNGLSLNTIEPYKEFLIAIAGPASNFMLALLGVPLIYLLGRSLPESTIRYFSIMNIRLGRFNLWPILAFDGGKILNALVRSTVGTADWTVYVSSAVSLIFMIYIFSKKKGHFELEHLIEKIP